MIKNILFDMDGTLVNCTKLQTHILEELFNSFNVDTTNMDLTKLIGPPLTITFAKYFGEDNVQTASARYKDLYLNTQIHSISIMPNIDTLLAKLKAQGYKLFVTSLQIQSVVKNELDYLGILHYFDDVRGDNLDKPYSSKAEVISDLLSDLSLNPAECVMVGDTDNDLIGGINNNLLAIGVMWGYGKHAFNNIQYAVHNTDELLFLLQQI